MKKVLVSLLSIALIGCSQPILSNTSQYSDLDKEYSQFTTKALTQSYLKKKMDKWLSDSKYSKNLVREIEYAKFKHKDLLKDIVALQPIMFDDITANTAVTTKRIESPFENYIEYINPYPSSVIANSATNITSSSFTANWTSNAKATSYKLFVNGSEVYSGANTSFDVTNLSFGTTPTYYVKTVNSAGTSPNSNTISVTLNPSAPVATDGTNITTNSFTANWGSVTGATNYKLFVNGSEVYSGANTSFNVTNLSFGSTPTYYVKAVNSAGTSPNSNTISVTLTANTVTALDATDLTQTSFTANWSPVIGATSYKLKVDAGAFTDVGAVTSKSITGLTIGTTHTYSVQAVNSGGTGSSSNIISVTLNPAVPAVPTTLVATNIGQTSFTANWNSVSGATSYKLKVDSGSYLDVGAVTSFDVTGLTIGTATAGSSHNYYVQASNISGTSAGSTARAVTLLPATPAVPVANIASSVTNTSFRANWASVSGATGYKLYIDGTLTYTGTNLYYDKSGVVSGSTHTYYVQAYNTGGTSANSNEISVSLLTHLTEVQSLSTSNANDVETFTIGTDNYLSISNESSNTEIYKWSTGTSQFVKIQDISTSKAHNSESFVIGTDTYLAVSNFSFSSTTDSGIYKWNTGTSQFVKIQDISTNAPYDWESFKIGTDTYLAVANHTDSSKIYKWNTGTSQFVEIQSVSMSTSHDTEGFTIGTNTYLALTGHDSNSAIYKWNTGTSQFTKFQDISLSSMVDTQYFTVGSDVYIACITEGSTSLVYKWNGTQFDTTTPFQTVSTSGGLDSAFFTIGTKSYLSIANYSGNSKVYRLD